MRYGIDQTHTESPVAIDPGLRVLRVHGKEGCDIDSRIDKVRLRR